MIYFPISQVTASEIAGFACYQRMFHGGLAEWDALPPREKDQFIPLNQDTWGNPLAHISRALDRGPGPGPGPAPGPGPGPGAILGPGARGSCQGPGPGANAAPQEIGDADIQEVCPDVLRMLPEEWAPFPEPYFYYRLLTILLTFRQNHPRGPLGLHFSGRTGSDRVGPAGFPVTNVNYWGVGRCVLPHQTNPMAHWVCISRVGPAALKLFIL